MACGGQATRWVSCVCPQVPCPWLRRPGPHHWEVRLPPQRLGLPLGSQAAKGRVPQWLPVLLEVGQDRGHVLSHARMRWLGARQRQLPHTPQVSAPGWPAGTVSAHSPLVIAVLKGKKPWPCTWAEEQQAPRGTGAVLGTGQLNAWAKDAAGRPQKRQVTPFSLLCLM